MLMGFIQILKWVFFLLNFTVLETELSTIHIHKNHSLLVNSFVSGYAKGLKDDVKGEKNLLVFAVTVR